MTSGKPKIGRNHPCPCGSRRQDGSRQKYKKCCIDRPSPFSPELAKRMNERHMKATAAEHAEFVEAHGRGECYICKLPYDQYDPAKPCAHWLMRPAGMKKDLVASVLERHGCFKPQAFVRWLANAEAFGININDMAMEGDPTKVFETTVKYKNLEWSFTCAESDLAGHKDRQRGKYPHFHFQMRIDGLPFIDYGQYHPALTDYDLFNIKVMRREIPGLVFRGGFGAGMGEVMNVLVDSGMEALKVAPDEATAQFHMQTIIEAEPGTGISGDVIADMQEESRRTGVPLSILMRRLKNVSAKTFVEAGPAVPEKASRRPKKR